MVVESVLDLCEITIGVFAKGEGVMKTGQSGLQVAKDGIKPIERVHLAASIPFNY